MTDQITVDSSAATYPVDAEHGALRMGVVIVFVAGWIVSFMILNALITNNGLNVIALLGSFIFTAVFTQQMEKVMRQRWPSGRRITIEGQHISVGKGSQVQEQVDAAKQVNVLLWRFKIKRRARVPKGWFMVACALEQDDGYLPVYTFMSPEDCDLLKVPNHFTLLTSKKEQPDQTAGKTDLRLAGEQRRLHTAENARWLNGAEMTKDDFIRYIRQLQEQFPQWMPSVL